MNFTAFLETSGRFSRHSIKPTPLNRHAWDKRWSPSFRTIARVATCASFTVRLKPCCRLRRIRKVAPTPSDRWLSLNSDASGVCHALVHAPPTHSTRWRYPPSRPNHLCSITRIRRKLRRCCDGTNVLHDGLDCIYRNAEVFLTEYPASKPIGCVKTNG
jgi:hypothetical protein